jgi:hypothetical protein
MIQYNFEIDIVGLSLEEAEIAVRSVATSHCYPSMRQTPGFEHLRMVHITEAVEPRTPNLRVNWRELDPSAVEEIYELNFKDTLHRDVSHRYERSQRLAIYQQQSLALFDRIETGNILIKGPPFSSVVAISVWAGPCKWESAMLFDGGKVAVTYPEKDQLRLVYTVEDSTRDGAIYHVAWLALQTISFDLFHSNIPGLDMTLTKRSIRKWAVDVLGRDDGAALMLEMEKQWKTNGLTEMNA